MYLPECIQKIVQDKPYRTDDVGMSGSQIRIYEEYVLKIQPLSAECENEKKVADWAKGKLPVPEILIYHVEEGMLYELRTKIQGEMLCSGNYLKDPAKVIRLSAQALKRLWDVDVTGCPDSVSCLTARLGEARRRVENGEAETNTEPETYGPGGFSGPEELIDWLEANRPEEDIVLTHGDFCLPNLFAQGDKLSGYIDIGKMGPADRWQDIAILIRTLHHNFTGYYGGPAVFPKFTPQMVLDELGITMNEEKYRYYLLLDEI